MNNYLTRSKNLELIIYQYPAIKNHRWLRLQVCVLKLFVYPFTTNSLRNIKKPAESVTKEKKDKKPAKRAKDPKDSKDTKERKAIKDTDGPQPSKSKKRKTK